MPLQVARLLVAPSDHGGDGREHHRHGNNDQNGINRHSLPPIYYAKGKVADPADSALRSIKPVGFRQGKSGPAATGRAA